jgi:hypothetical protein
LGNFSESVHVRTKLAENIHVGLWDQPIILTSSLGRYILHNRKIWKDDIKMPSQTGSQTFNAWNS